MKPSLLLAWLAGCIAMVSVPWGQAANTNPPTWTAIANADWRPVEGSTTYVMPGSALDMSRFVEAPAGKYGRVLWFQMTRPADKSVRYVPHLIDAQSGVGCQVVAADVNTDGRVDVLTVSQLGAFVFVNRPEKPATPR